jgi:uncharacterized protein YbaR (Trm112 family)
MQLNIQIPETMPDNAASDEEFLRNLHHVLCDIHVQEGALCCPGCAREFPITQGIPNMVRHRRHCLTQAWFLFTLAYTLLGFCFFGRLPHSC